MAPPRRHCQPRHAAVSSGHLHSGSSSCGVKRRGVKPNEIGAISEPDRSDIGVLGGDSGRPQHGTAGPERPELCSEAQTAPARARARAPRAAGDKSLLCYLPGRRPNPFLALALVLALASPNPFWPRGRASNSSTAPSSSSSTASGAAAAELCCASCARSQRG